MVRRNRNGVRKERIIMLATSALVLTALTVTGVFVRRSNDAEKEDYVVDFDTIGGEDQLTAENMLSGDELDTLFADVGTDDLDYDPNFQEANSQNVENSGDKLSASKQDGSDQGIKSKTSVADDGQGNSKEKAGAKTEVTEQTGKSEEEEEGMFDETVDTASQTGEPETAEAISTTVQPALDFHDEDGLVWPIVGDVLINYSMDKTVYFPTLQQYKYNPAIVIAASQGDNITAAANGRVTSVAYDPTVGNTVVTDLGNGYELTYGQLENIIVSEGSYVSVGDSIGTVASPTRYYSMEGTNVYFKLTKDGEPVNPMTQLQ